MVQSSKDDTEIEGNYRLIRNKHVTADPIAESGLLRSRHTHKTMMNISPRRYDHAVIQPRKYTGFEAHSILLFSPKYEHTIGLIEQRRWMRDSENFGNSKYNGRRAYKDKESYK